MPQLYYSSNAASATLSTSLASAASGSTGTLVVSSITGYPVNFPFTILVDWNTASAEVITVTQAATGTGPFTYSNVIRGDDGTAASAHTAPTATINHGVSARDFQKKRSLENVLTYGADPTGSASVLTPFANAIAAAAAAGTDSSVLIPAGLYNGAGWVIKNVSNFYVEGRQIGSIGWGANASHDTGSQINTGSGTDGVQIYSDGTAETQGVWFKALSFVGSNTNAVVHYGGRQRRCGGEDVYIQNTNAATGAYAMILDAGLVNFNSENQIFHRYSLVGAYAALGISTSSGASWKANDTDWYDLVTASTGPYSVINNDGSNHNFYNFYDRSSPSIATVWNQNGILYFHGGEDLNNAAGGATHLVASGGVTILHDRAVTDTGGQTTLVVQGRLIMEGRCRASGIANVTGTLDITDPRLSISNLTITGNGTVYMAPGYNTGSNPSFAAGWTGNIIYVPLPAVQASNRQSAQTGTSTVSWTPPKQNSRVRISVMVRVTTAGTSTVCNLTMTAFGGAPISQSLPLMKIDGSTTALVLSATANGTYVGTFFMDTDASGTAVQVQLVGTGSTYTYSIAIEQLS